MEIFINGVHSTCESQLLAELITEQKIDTHGIAVAVGQRIIPRDKWSQTKLCDQDRITIIRATQGG